MGLLGHIMPLSCPQPPCGSPKFSPRSTNWPQPPLGLSSQNIPLDGCALPPPPPPLCCSSDTSNPGVLFPLPGTPNFAWVAPSLNTGLDSNVILQRPPQPSLSPLSLSISLYCSTFLYSVNHCLTYLSSLLSVCLLSPCKLPEGFVHFVLCCVVRPANGAWPIAGSR